MTLLTSWISVLTAFLLLLHFWGAKIYASGNPEEEIDYTYVIIGVTLGALLSIGFVAVIICMIKTQMFEHVSGESDGKMDRRLQMPGDPLCISQQFSEVYGPKDFPYGIKMGFKDTLQRPTALMENLYGLVKEKARKPLPEKSNMGSSQNRDDIHVLENLSTKDQ